ncbi:MAG: hypothetical protein JW829_17225, partial [Pirellulales bacterium]|nr:hypothetical protein [Pirellulales bacterium]
MFGRKPTTAALNSTIVVCAALLALTAGCAGWRLPRIDPTGERFLIWPNELPGAGTVGPPVFSTGPTSSPIPPAIASLGPPGTAPDSAAQTLPEQTTLADPSASTSSSQNIDAAPVWPSPNATSIFPNGFVWPGRTGLGSQPLLPPDACLETGGWPGPSCGLFGPICDPNPCLDPCANLWDPCLPGPIGSPPIVAGPYTTFAPGGPVDHILLAPKRLMAPVGSEVILRAGICTEDGHLISNQRIEWLLANEGVGELIDVGESCWLHPLRRPKKVNNHFAVGRTSSRAFTIDRGTPDPGDDVPVQDGETWISVTSPIEGTSLVTAVAPNIDTWKRRKTTATIHWIDAQWIFPKPTRVATGAQHLLTTTVTRRSTPSPIAGWQVRYEVLDRGAAGFAPDGAEVINATTDASGHATVEIFQADPKVPSA